jgi:glutamyl-tRNA reductase
MTLFQDYKSILVFVDRFGIIHFSKSIAFPEDKSFQEQIVSLLQDIDAMDSYFIKFETCMRKTYFFDTCRMDSSALELLNKVQTTSYIQRIDNEEAYKLILEIITGLKSTIKGETEIFGQFKIFFENFKLKNWHSVGYLNRIFEQLIQDCKSLREKHVKNWGSQSYGSLTRKLLDKNTPLVVIGSGQLAKEIAPWLSQIKTKYLLLRNMNKETDAEFQSFKHIHMESFKEAQEAHGSINIVLAAPISNLDLKAVIGQARVNKLIDWRGDQKIDFDINLDEYFHLNDIKMVLAESEESLEEKVQAVQLEIQKMIESFGKKVQLNPWGWDDICA